MKPGSIPRQRTPSSGTCGSRARVTAVLVACLAAVAFAGCLGQSGGANPNLLAPKLVVDTGTDDAPLVFVHSAIGDRQYDRIEVRVDNGTPEVREDVYSFEVTLDADAFFLDVLVVSGDARFTFTGTFRVDPENEQIGVSVLDADGEWGEPRETEIPFERIISREEGDDA